jgi:hypothetical protein
MLFTVYKSKLVKSLMFSQDLWCAIWCRVDSYVGTNIAEEFAAAVFNIFRKAILDYSEEAGGEFPRNLVSVYQ